MFKQVYGDVLIMISIELYLLTSQHHPLSDTTSRYVRRLLPCLLSQGVSKLADMQFRHYLRKKYIGTLFKYHKKIL